MTIHSLEEEYSAAREAAVIVDLDRRGRIRVGGRDRVDLIQRLSTNDMRDLAPGRGISNLFLTNKGRIFSFFDALAFSDHLRLFLPGGDARAVAEWIERFVFVEDVVAEDVTASTFEFGVYGPAAAAALAAAGVDASGLEGRDHRDIPDFGAAIIGAAEPLSGSGYRISGDRDHGERIWRQLIEQGAACGLRAAGPETLDTLRIEAGLPAPGTELTEQWNPLEAELRSVVSFTKGCYTGQEVVARLNTYKKVQRILRCLRLDGGEVPALGTRVLAEGQPVGIVTSATRSPALEAPLALAYVDLAASEHGTRLGVEIEPGGRLALAEVVMPPLATAAS